MMIKICHCNPRGVRKTTQNKDTIIEACVVEVNSNALVIEHDMKGSNIEKDYL